MKNRALEKIAAVACALCLAVGVMSSVVFARDVEHTDTAPAEEDTFVIVNDGPEETPEPPAETADNRTSIPWYLGNASYGVCPLVNEVVYIDPEAFCEAMGLDPEASLSEDGYSYWLEAEGLSITAYADDIYFVCNGRYLYTLYGLQAIDGRAYLPLKAMAKCLGVSYTLDNAAWRVTVEDAPARPLRSGSDFYDETDLYWLSRVIYAEAGNQTLYGQLAVGNVVLNRVADDSFAQDTIYDVIFAKNQFEVVTNGMIYMTPGDSAVIAAKLALEGYDVVEGATYFATYNFRGYECVMWIGDHCFMVPG